MTCGIFFLQSSSLPSASTGQVTPTSDALNTILISELSKTATMQYTNPIDFFKNTGVLTPQQMRELMIALRGYIDSMLLSSIAKGTFNVPASASSITQLNGSSHTINGLLGAGSPISIKQGSFSDQSYFLDTQQSITNGSGQTFVYRNTSVYPNLFTISNGMMVPPATKIPSAISISESTGSWLELLRNELIGHMSTSSSNVYTSIQDRLSAMLQYNTSTSYNFGQNRLGYFDGSYLGSNFVPAADNSWNTFRTAAGYNSALPGFYPGVNNLQYNSQSYANQKLLLPYIYFGDMASSDITGRPKPIAIIAYYYSHTAWTNKPAVLIYYDLVSNMVVVQVASSIVPGQRISNADPVNGDATWNTSPTNVQVSKITYTIYCNEGKIYVTMSDGTGGIATQTAELASIRPAPAAIPTPSAAAAPVITKSQTLIDNGFSPITYFFAAIIIALQDLKFENSFNQATGQYITYNNTQFPSFDTTKLSLVTGQAPSSLLLSNVTTRAQALNSLGLTEPIAVREQILGQHLIATEMLQANTGSTGTVATIFGKQPILVFQEQTSPSTRILAPFTNATLDSTTFTVSYNGGTMTTKPTVYVVGGFGKTLAPNKLDFNNPWNSDLSLGGNDSLVRRVVIHPTGIYIQMLYKVVDAAKGINQDGLGVSIQYSLSNNTIVYTQTYLEPANNNTAALYQIGQLTYTITDTGFSIVRTSGSIQTQLVNRTYA